MAVSVHVQWKCSWNLPKMLLKLQNFNHFVRNPDTADSHDQGRIFFSTGSATSRVWMIVSCGRRVCTLWVTSVCRQQQQQQPIASCVLLCLQMFLLRLNHDDDDEHGDDLNIDINSSCDDIADTVTQPTVGCDNNSTADYGWVCSMSLLSIIIFLTELLTEQSIYLTVSCALVILLLHTLMYRVAHKHPTIFEHCLSMCSPADNVGQDVMCWGCAVRRPSDHRVCSFIQTDISSTLLSVLIKLTGNIHWPLLMTWLDSGGQSSRS